MTAKRETVQEKRRLLRAEIGFKKQLTVKGIPALSDPTTNEGR